MNTPQPWQRVRSRSILRNRWLTVRQDTVMLPDGTEIDDYFVTELPDVALVMPVTPQGKVVFVRQYRHAAEQIMLELPAGTFDAQKETAETAAIRELREETGYHAERVERLGAVYDNPVKSTSQTHLFLARDVVPVDVQRLDITEEIEVVTLALEAIPDAIATGEIAVSGSITALHLGLAYLSV